MRPEFKIYKPIQLGIFLTFATINVVGEPYQQIPISAKIFGKHTGCLQPSNTMGKELSKSSYEWAENGTYLVPLLQCHSKLVPEIHEIRFLNDMDDPILVVLQLIPRLLYHLEF